MEKSSKELLKFEHNAPCSLKDTALLVCGNSTKSCVQDNQVKPSFDAPIPSSQVLGRVKDFLGVMAEANKNLELKAKEKPEDYNIEALNGNESEFIEMDLMLGVTDLHTPEAMAAAEAAIAGNQPVLNLYKNEDDSSEWESSSDDEDEDEDEDEDDSDSDQLMKGDGLVKQQSESNKRKRTTIVELA